MDIRLRSKAIFTNTKLEELCKIENVNFSNFWEQFVDKNHLFRRDGLHLNDVGDSRLGRLLDTEVRKVLKKINNAHRDFRLETDTTSELKAASFNARSLRNKFNEFRAIVYSKNFDLIPITETWCNFKGKDFEFEYKINGYQLFQIGRA